MIAKGDENMSKRSIVLHLDIPWYDALSRQLKKEDMTVEEKLDEYLDTLIDQLPERVREKISRQVWEERQRQVAEAGCHASTFDDQAERKDDDE